MTQTPGAAARLLPWSGPEGKPCYVVGDGTGRVSRVADNVESVQLDMALELLDHADDMLDDGQVTSAQLRYVLARMAEALRDVHRIARSRGDRLAASADDGGSPVQPQV
ncbi:hypothetical protein [Streptomyces sp. NBC_00893]|uniref:hypothetical protein n=1 Tax=Streptomyces sp. NBC_00893 TaxID=2975862 RepID=UPI00225440DF|nr:hypothetical protein [Streptomyces sp. NBC_00893]MCX4847892.1 hypothetical protein [Streptomyces sp. NBC_00893]